MNEKWPFTIHAFLLTFIQKIGWSIMWHSIELSSLNLPAVTNIAALIATCLRLSASAHNLLVPAPGPDDGVDRKRVAYPPAITVSRRCYRAALDSILLHQHPQLTPCCPVPSPCYTVFTGIAVVMGSWLKFATTRTSTRREYGAILAA